MKTSGERYPLHELEEYLGWPTAAWLGERLGVETLTILQWRVRGLSHKQADRAATAFDLYPTQLWPTWELRRRFPGEARRPERRTRPENFPWHYSRIEAWNGRPKAEADTG